MPHSSTKAWRANVALAVAPLALLAACSTPPSVTGPAGASVFGSQRDGPPAQPPPDLTTRPDPQPQVEPIRVGGPNKPYEVFGQRYTPLAADLPLAQTGLASWYGRKFHGRPTASGEIYDMYATTAAHRTMPLPSYALVRNPANGREIVVRVNDRGPFHAERIIDLSYAAAAKLGVLRGVAPVELRRLTHDDIRSARWRGETLPAVAATDAALGGASADAALPIAAPQVVATLPQPLAAEPPQPPQPMQQQPVVEQPSPQALALSSNDATAAKPSFAAYWLQLGAFRQRQGAHDLRQQLAQQLGWLDPLLAIFDEGALVRLQVGPFDTRRQAQDMAERIVEAALGLQQPVVVQRRR